MVLLCWILAVGKLTLPKPSQFKKNTSGNSKVCYGIDGPFSSMIDLLKVVVFHGVTVTWGFSMKPGWVSPIPVGHLWAVLAVFPTFLKRGFLRRFPNIYCPAFVPCFPNVPGICNTPTIFPHVLWKKDRILGKLRFSSLLNLFPQFFSRCSQQFSKIFPKIYPKIYPQDLSLGFSPGFPPFPYSSLHHLRTRPCFHSVCAACLQSLASSEGDAFDCPRCGRRTQKMWRGDSPNSLTKLGVVKKKYVDGKWYPLVI